MANASESLEDKLVSIASGLEIMSESRIRFGGRTIHVDDPWWSLSSPHGVSPREKVTHAISLALYYGAYCHGGMSELRVVETDLVPDPAFVHRLSVANQTHRSTEKGWNLIQRDSDGVVRVCKAGRFRAAARGDYIELNARESGCGHRLFELRVAREDRHSSPTAYFAYSESLPSHAEDMDNVRFYFHCDRDSIADAVKVLTTTLNEHFIPFRIKCLNHPSLYGRADSLVLYVERRDVDVVTRIAVMLVKQAMFRLSSQVPLFTKRLVDGIGVAEDSGVGISFGQQRSRLLAEAFHNAHDANRLRDPSVITFVEASFREAGLDLHRPHLNPGSVDCYSLPSHTTEKATSPLPTTSKVASRFERQCLQAAAGIGRILVRDVVWAGDKCNWLTQAMVPTQRGTKSIVKACPAGLDEGIAGIGLFLARLYRVTGDPLTADVVSGVCRQLINSISADDEAMAAAIVEIANTAELQVEAELAAERFKNLGIDGSFTLSVGLTKCNVSVTPDLQPSADLHPQPFADPLAADAALGMPNLQAAIDIAVHVLQMTEHHGQPWRSDVGLEYPPLSLRSGISGVGHFLLRMYSSETPSLTS